MWYLFLTVTQTKYIYTNYVREFSRKPLNEIRYQPKGKTAFQIPLDFCSFRGLAELPSMLWGLLPEAGAEGTQKRWNRNTVSQVRDLSTGKSPAEPPKSMRVPHEVAPVGAPATRAGKQNPENQSRGNGLVSCAQLHKRHFSLSFPFFQAPMPWRIQRIYE